MTIAQFVSRFARKVKRTKAQFYRQDQFADVGVKFARSIRTKSGWGENGKGGVGYPHCPLSFVAGTEACCIRAAAKKLGLKLESARRIMKAADGQDGRLRKQLLKAANIT